MIGEVEIVALPLHAFNPATNLHYPQIFNLITQKGGRMHPQGPQYYFHHDHNENDLQDDHQSEVAQLTELSLPDETRVGP